MALNPKPYGQDVYGEGPYGYERVETELGGTTGMTFGAAGDLSNDIGIEGQAVMSFGATGTLGEAWLPAPACTPGTWQKVRCSG
jgi:hypothetical protein